MPPAAYAPNFLAGDIAPRGNPDGQLNAGDLVVLQRIAMGQITADAYELQIGDVAPLGAPDGQINAADVAVLQRAIFGLVTLTQIDPNPPSTPIPDLLASLTTESSVVVSGQADAGSTVRVYVNAAVVASGIAGADGTFSMAAPLNEGVNVIQLSALESGLESALSSAMSVVLDSVVPTIGTGLSVTPLSGGRIRVTGSTEANAQVGIDSADGQTVFGNSDASGNFVIELNGQPTDSLSVRAIDTAGNVSVPRNTTAVGATAGQFEVDSSGAASYTIPLSIPPGAAGMQPDLSLAFNSRVGNGLLGVGWSLGGLSAITRCPQTLAEDNAVGTIRFDAEDRFCLDGQRLIAISGVYGASGTEYRTERESFTRVVSYGTGGSGPAWFRAWTKSGQILGYGRTVDSRIEATGLSDVMVWAVDRIEDRVGNYLTVQYNEDSANGVYEPTVIRYTGNNATGLVASQSVTFNYQSRPDTTASYLAGIRLQRTRRLASITTSDGASLVKRYNLAYDTGSVSGRSRLVSVTECDAANQCYPPTVFNWQNGSNTLVDDNIWATGKYANFNSQLIRIGDTTGDGLDDVLLGPDSNYQWHILRSIGSGFDDGSSTTGGLWYDVSSNPMPCGRRAEFIHGIDGIGNGVMDIVVLPANLFGDIYTLNSGGVEAYISLEGRIRILSSCGVDSFFKMDIDGDGLVDLVRQRDFWVVGNASSGFEDRGYQKPDGLPTGWDPALAFEVDMNADGRGDLLSGPGNWTVVASTGSGFEVKAWASGLYAGWLHARRPMDVNGDGLPDMVLGPNPAGNWFVLLNSGTGFVDAGQWASNSFGSWAENASALLRIRPMDTNGDGLQDLLLGPDSNGDWVALESTGSGFVQSLKLSNAYADWYVIRQTGTTPNQLASIRSLTVTTDITYTQSRGSTSPFFATYPVQNLTRPLTVVGSVSTDDGIGGSYQTTYGYDIPKIDLHGRGFLGFRVMTQTDSRTNISTTTNYAQNYPYTGMVKRVQQRDAQNQLLSQTTNTFAALELDNTDNAVCTTACQTDNLNGRRHFPYVATSVEEAYNLASGVLESSAQTDVTYDTSGNVTQLTVTTKGPLQSNAWVKGTVNTYADDTANWLLGRLARAEVTHNAPGQPPITRVSAFAYDTRGLLVQEVIEPDQPNTPFILTTDYSYDAFGNRNSVTVTGLKGTTAAEGQQIRVTSTQYDANGRFPISTTNDPGHTETYVYDSRFGVRTQLTGPNGLATNWTYDRFGRMTRETRADGNVTDVSYRWCGADCPNGGYAVDSLCGCSVKQRAITDAL